MLVLWLYGTSVNVPPFIIEPICNGRMIVALNTPFWINYSTIVILFRFLAKTLVLQIYCLMVNAAGLQLCLKPP